MENFAFSMLTLIFHTAGCRDGEQRDHCGHKAVEVVRSVHSPAMSVSEWLSVLSGMAQEAD